MGLRSRRKYVQRILVLLLASIPVIVFSPCSKAQKDSKKLTKQDVIDLLTQDATNEDVASAARDAGISFQVTASVEKEIRAAGGKDNLIRVLRSLAPHPSAPPPVAPHTAPAALSPRSDDRIQSRPKPGIRG